MKTLADYILLLKGAMPLDMCEALIARYDSISENDPLKVHRKNKILDFEEINMLNHDAFKEFQSPMMQLMKAVNDYYLEKTANILKDRLPCYEPLKDFEAPRIKRYEPGTGIFDWHTDHCDVPSSKRAIVMFWYLNDVAEGGETVFDIGTEISIKPEAGSAILFPSSSPYSHTAHLVKSGHKYMCPSFWFTGTEFIGD
jgi:hypothetical protein